MVVELVFVIVEVLVSTITIFKSHLQVI
jgi:hypothetical protein